MKPFQALLIGAAVWGVTLALAFVGGIAIGNSQEAEAATGASSAQHIDGDGQQGQFDPDSREEFRRQFQSGEATQEELDQLRQRFQQSGGGQFRGPGGGGQGGGNFGDDHDSN